ncbi:MAG: tetratricopeptide repeat protein [Deltaproteobacteria bacterium]|nr:tetratricopeptide repeat protein [Deltaproteobacteria bacterium]
MKIRMTIIAAFAIFLGLVGPAFAASETGHALYFSANRDFRQGNFEQAAEKYESLVKSGRAGGDVYYNLGNTRFRQNRIGEAILNYQRARLFMPRDRDLVHNLRFALDKRLNPPDSLAEEARKGILRNFTDREAFGVFAVINAAFFLALALRLWMRREWTYYLVAALGIAWISTGLFAGAMYWDSRTDKACVITAPKVEVRSGPSLKETVLFTLNEGAMADSERQESGFRLIMISPDKRGWVPARLSPKIRPEA